MSLKEKSRLWNHFGYILIKLLIYLTVPGKVSSFHVKRTFTYPEDYLDLH